MMLLFTHERKEIREAQNNGEKCTNLRIIELAESLNCNIACNTPGSGNTPDDTSGNTPGGLVVKREQV